MAKKETAAQEKMEERGDMASPLSKSLTRKFSPVVRINADVDSFGGIGSSDSSWRKEECARIKAEIKALEKELANFDSKATAERVRRSLEIRLKQKKFRLEEHNMKMRPEY